MLSSMQFCKVYIIDFLIQLHITKHNQSTLKSYTVVQPMPTINLATTK